MVILLKVVLLHKDITFINLCRHKNQHCVIGVESPLKDDSCHVLYVVGNITPMPLKSIPFHWRI